jgi:TatA/E family protein of Tat protein translocase
MFDLGIQELILIFVVALLVFGPKRLPEIAQSMGRAVGELKKAMSGVKDQIDAEMREVKGVKELKELKDPIALKNELFGNDDIFKIDEPAVTPKADHSGEGQHKPEETKAAKVETSEKAPDNTEQKGLG